MHMQAPLATIPTHTVRRWIVLIGALYVTQGIPVGVTMLFVPTLMRQHGAPLDVIGLTALTMLPWALKFLWAPWVDRHGTRRAWIIPLQTLLALLLWGMGAAALESQTPWLALALLLLVNLTSATQDIATDGFAVDALARPGLEHPLAWVNGLQIGGFSLGMCIGGALMLVVYDGIGYRAAFAGLGALVLLGLIPVVSWPQASRQDSSHRNATTPIDLRQFFKRPQAGLMLMAAALFHSQHVMTASLLRAFLVDLGASAAIIGLMTGTAILLTATCASMLGALLVNRFGVHLALRAGLSVSALIAASWIFIAQWRLIDWTALFAIIVLTNLFYGTAYVALFTLFMRWAAGTQSGTDFTMLQCADACSGIALTAMAGAIAQQLGFTAGFSCAAMFGLAAVLGVFKLCKVREGLAWRGSQSGLG